VTDHTLMQPWLYPLQDAAYWLVLGVSVVITAVVLWREITR
jgi:hypothetical protein